MPEILFKGRAVENFLTECVESFYDLKPAVMRAFERIVDEESKSLLKPTAMSEHGHFLNFCKLPADLATFIRQQYRLRFEPVDFFADPDNYYLLCSIFKKARVRRTPTQLLTVPSFE